MRATGTGRIAVATALVALCALGCAAWLPATAMAQGTSAGASPGSPPRYDMTLGGGLVTGGAMGSGDASLRANATTPQSYPLFTTRSELGPTAGVDVRFAGRAAGRLSVEGQFRVSQPTLTTTVTDDAESARDVSVSTPVTEILAGGGVRLRLDGRRRTATLLPYVSAGAGVLRQMYDGGAFVEQRPVFYAGGGVGYGLGARSRGYVRQGVRVDAQWLVTDVGSGPDEGMSTRASVTGGVFFSF